MDRPAARGHLESLITSDLKHDTLGLLYGRRRIGKSTLLADLADAHGGFYWEATRGEPAVHLARLSPDVELVDLDRLYGGG
jgi:hypothetical protein